LKHQLDHKAFADSRGIERRKICRDNKDREDFIERLARILPETETACYGWSIMTNHAHFLFRSGGVGLATLMRRLLTGYAVRRGEKIAKQRNYQLLA
jgi:hypothetical protein